MLLPASTRRTVWLLRVFEVTIVLQYVLWRERRVVGPAKDDRIDFDQLVMGTGRL